MPWDQHFGTPFVIDLNLRLTSRLLDQRLAPAGAEVLKGDPNAGGPTHRVPCDVPERQYPVLRDGRP